MARAQTQSAVKTGRKTFKGNTCEETQGYESPSSLREAGEQGSPNPPSAKGGLGLGTWSPEPGLPLAHLTSHLIGKGTLGSWSLPTSWGASAAQGSGSGTALLVSQSQPDSLILCVFTCKLETPPCASWIVDARRCEQASPQYPDAPSPFLPCWEARRGVDSGGCVSVCLSLCGWGGQLTNPSTVWPEASFPRTALASKTMGK